MRSTSCPNLEDVYGSLGAQLGNHERPTSLGLQELRSILQQLQALVQRDNTEIPDTHVDQQLVDLGNCLLAVKVELLWLAHNMPHHGRVIGSLEDEVELLDNVRLRLLRQNDSSCSSTYSSGRRSIRCPSPDHRSLDSLLHPGTRQKQAECTSQRNAPELQNNDEQKGQAGHQKSLKGQAGHQKSSELDSHSLPRSRPLSRSAGGWNLQNSSPTLKVKSSPECALKQQQSVSPQPSTVSSGLHTPQRDDAFSISSSLFAVSPLLHVSQVVPQLTEIIDDTPSSPTWEPHSTANVGLPSLSMGQRLAWHETSGSNSCHSRLNEEQPSLRKELSCSSNDSLVSLRVVAGVPQLSPRPERGSVVGKRQVHSASHERPLLHGRTTRTPQCSPASSAGCSPISPRMRAVHIPGLPKLDKDRSQCTTNPSAKSKIAGPARRLPQIPTAACPGVQHAPTESKPLEMTELEREEWERRYARVNAILKAKFGNTVSLSSRPKANTPVDRNSYSAKAFSRPPSGRSCLPTTIATVHADGSVRVSARRSRSASRKSRPSSGQKLQRQPSGDPQKSAQQTTSQDRRLLVAQEIVETERKYVKLLNTIIEVFAKPIKFLHLISQHATDCIFPKELQQLLQIHQQLLEELEQCLAVWPSDCELGKIFARINTSQEVELLTIYISYINKFPDAMRVLSQNMRLSDCFCSFLNDCGNNPACEGLDLPAFLLTPVQRLPRYVMLLKRLIKYTQQDNKDWSALQAVINMMKKKLQELDSSIEMSFQIAAQLWPNNRTLCSPLKRSWSFQSDCLSTDGESTWRLSRLRKSSAAKSRRFEERAVDVGDLESSGVLMSSSLTARRKILAAARDGQRSKTTKQSKPFWGFVNFWHPQGGFIRKRAAGKSPKEQQTRRNLLSATTVESTSTSSGVSTRQTQACQSPAALLNGHTDVDSPLVQSTTMVTVSSSHTDGHDCRSTKTAVPSIGSKEKHSELPGHDVSMSAVAQHSGQLLHSILQEVAAPQAPGKEEQVSLRTNTETNRHCNNEAIFQKGYHLQAQPIDSSERMPPSQGASLEASKSPPYPHRLKVAPKSFQFSPGKTPAWKSKSSPACHQQPSHVEDFACLAQQGAARQKRRVSAVIQRDIEPTGFPSSTEKQLTDEHWTVHKKTWSHKVKLKIFKGKGNRSKKNSDSRNAGEGQLSVYTTQSDRTDSTAPDIGSYC